MLHEEGGSHWFQGRPSSPRVPPRAPLVSLASYAGPGGVRHVPLRCPEARRALGHLSRLWGFQQQAAPDPGAGGSPTGRAAQSCVAVVTGNRSCCPRSAACPPLGPPVPPRLFRCLSLAVFQGEDPEPVMSLKQSPLCERLCQWPRKGLFFQKSCVMSVPGPCPQVPWVLLRLWVSPSGPTLCAEAAAPELGA